MESCLNTTDWRLDIPFSTKMTTSARRATTVFNRLNFTIIDLMNLSNAVPTDYAPEDLFAFYDIIFAINPSEPNWYQTAQYLLLIAITTYLGTDADTQQATGSEDRLLKLEEFLAVPIFLFNNVAYGGGGPTPDMGTSITLATASYKVLCPFFSPHLAVNYCFIHPLYLYCRCASHAGLVHYSAGIMSAYSSSQCIVVSGNRYGIKKCYGH